MKVFLYFFNLYLHSFPEILDHLYYHYSAFFFFLPHIDYIFPLHLVVLIGFYLAPSSTVYFFVISFYQAYSAFFLPQTEGSLFLLLLCLPPSGEADPGLCAGFLLRDCFLFSGGWSWVLSFVGQSLHLDAGRER